MLKSRTTYAVTKHKYSVNKCIKNYKMCRHLNSACFMFINRFTKGWQNKLYHNHRQNQMESMQPRPRGKTDNTWFQLMLALKVMLSVFSYWSCKKIKLTKNRPAVSPVPHYVIFETRMNTSCAQLIKLVWINVVPNGHQNLESHFPLLSAEAHNMVSYCSHSA